MSNSNVQRGHAVRRRPLANSRTIVRPAPGFNPCLNSDMNQTGCATEQPEDPHTRDHDQDLFMQHEFMIPAGGRAAAQRYNVNLRAGGSSNVFNQLPHIPSSAGPPATMQPQSSTVYNPQYTASSMFTGHSTSTHWQLQTEFPRPQISHPQYPPFLTRSFEHPHEVGSLSMRQLSGRVPPAVSSYGGARAAPYVLPGVHYVAAYAPLRPNEHLRGAVVTAGVFRAGVETSVTNDPPPLRRLPPIADNTAVSTSSNIPRSMATATSEPTANVNAQTRMSVTNTITPTKTQLQEISKGVRDAMRCKVLMINVLPSKLVQKETARDALKESASAVLGDHLAALWCNQNEPKCLNGLVAVIGTIRMIFKSTARSIVHTCYGLRPDIQDSQADAEVEQKKDLIPQLLAGNVFLHKLLADGNYSLFEHEGLISLLIDAIWLGGLHEHVEDTVDAFIHVVSLAGAALFSSFNEHREGIFQAIDFSPVTSGVVYQEMIHAFMADIGMLDGLTHLKDLVKV
ncbi:hypothetical protein PAXRUDRAFT_10168 [Paxillus rubicundulus Ve08.2h10]|uniref:DUF6532 domain-containing protein n=1 Tax=Paxillus rubicundulus Ve08.2h10 TaxID=930991 RepID=A0A0D0EBD8_9AGAM|nr:hypothetical protein PAXRUDRAFT_10168 [Paxillus rubicundulus Ve08.2h10]